MMRSELEFWVNLDRKQKIGDKIMKIPKELDFNEK